MKFKSKLGFAALEDLKDDIENPAGAEGEGEGEGKPEGEDNAAAAAAPAAGEGEGAAAPDADAAAADAGAAAAADAGGDAGAAASGDVGGDAGGDAGAAGEGGDAGAGTDDGAAGADAGATGEGEGEGADTGAGASDAEAAAAADAAAGAVDATGNPDEVVGEDDADTAVVDEQMDAIDNIDDQAEDVNDDVEDLTVATEALEGCVAILGASIERGGLDVFGASLLRNNVNTVTNLLKRKPMLLPAMEDMETPSARIGAASDAKDGLVAFIKRMLEALKQAFVRFGQWIVETYKRLTDVFVAIERRAQKLGETVKTSTMKEGALDSKGLAAKLQIRGATVEDLKSTLSSIGSFARYANDPKSYKHYLEALDLCEDMVKNPEKAEEIRGQVSQKLAAWGDEFHRSASKFKLEAVDGKPVDDSGVQRFGVALLGNQTTEIVIPATAEKIGAMSAATHDLSNTGEPGAVEALDQTTAQAICQQVAELAKALRESGDSNKGGVKELNAEIAKRKDTMVALMSAKSSDSESSELVRKVALFVNTFFMSAPKIPAHAINKAMPRSLQAALDYVAASIGGAAEKSAAPADAKKLPA